MKKIVFLLLTCIIICQPLFAEIVSGFQVQSTYLQGGKIKVNNTGATAFKIDVGFTRYLSGSSYESVDINFKLVVINNASGQVIQDLTSLTHIVTSDFASNSGYLGKTYDINLTYSTLGITAQNVRIALLWKSSRNSPPAGYPNGLWAWDPTYQIELVQSTFYNTAKSGSFTRNDCGSGYIGSAVTYTVAANAYSSTISQADADQKAQNDVNNNGQAYANANGTCSVPVTYYNTTQSGSFTRNNCGAGYVGSAVTYTVAANIYSSTISQADANQKAQNDVNTNGQNYANANGTCSVQPISIVLKCLYIRTPKVVPVTNIVEFIQNGVVVKTAEFPKIENTQLVLSDVPAGTYTLRFTISSDYKSKNMFLSYVSTLSPIGLWDKMPGQTVVTTDPVNIVSGTYTITSSDGN